MHTDTHLAHASIAQTMNRVFHPNAYPQETRDLKMAAHEMHVIDAGRRRRDVIRCLQGRLWVTQEGDWRDHLLRAGEVFLAAKAGRILISALDDARVQVASTRNARC
jgi:hypothetical protein